MIAFLPELYADELVYSWLSRYYVKSGYLSFTYAVEDLYTHQYTRPDVEFLNELKPDVMDVIKRYCNMDRLIQEHTMFSLYGRFLPQDRKKEAYEALLRMNGNFNNLLSIPKNQRGTGRFLRYCPVCAREDREKHGETYWHRIHQIEGIRICRKHHCYLCESKISMDRKKTAGFWDAEALIPQNETMQLCRDEKEIAFTEYIGQVFETVMDFQGKVSAADFLKLRLERYARTNSGASISLDNLYMDYQNFYGENDCMTKGQMQKILLGVKYHVSDICKLAMFAGIPAKELVAIPDTVKDSLREPVYQQVSEELQIDYDLVCKIGEAVLKRYEGRERIVQRRKRAFTWEKMDEEMLPNVRKTVKRLYQTGEERPRRITVSLVQKEMGFPDKRFDKLPKCKAEILKYQETQKEYWARQSVWAYRKLVRESQPVNWSHIRRMTNMRKVDFQGCKVFLDNYGTKEEVEYLQGLI